MLRSFLETAGVYAYVRADDVGGMRPDLALVRGADLLVSADQLPAARNLLAEARKSFEENS